MVAVERQLAKEVKEDKEDEECHYYRGPDKHTSPPTLVLTPFELPVHDITVPPLRRRLRWTRNHPLAIGLWALKGSLGHS